MIRKIERRIRAWWHRHDAPAPRPCRVEWGGWDEYEAAIRSMEGSFWGKNGIYDRNRF